MRVRTWESFDVRTPKDSVSFLPHPSPLPLGEGASQSDAVGSQPDGLGGHSDGLGGHPDALQVPSQWDFTGFHAVGGQKETVRSATDTYGEAIREADANPNEF